ncbi:hypothetical protein CMU93_04155 [Elizabethkingia anophelis]|nr:hypothetical protein [Elizabethkingia anophelis]
MQSSVLSVCRQALETDEQIADGLDFSQMLELVQRLIPHAELELLTFKQCEVTILKIYALKHKPHRFLKPMRFMRIF